MTSVTVDRLSVEFRPKLSEPAVLALDDLSFEVGEGEILCLVGPSGCGKSTVLNVLAGITKSKMDGSVAVSGKAVVDDSRGASRGKSIGYMFQRDTLLPWLTTLDNVALPLRFQGVKDRAGIALGLLRTAGLEQFAKMYPNALSGGMRKRVQLVQVLAQDPTVLLMDEPFGALDAQTRLLMQLEFLAAWERDRKTVIFVTHDLNEAILVGDRIICMSARPGRAKFELPVSIKRPRSIETLAGTKEWVELYESLWLALKDEAQIALSGRT
ncbi:ABC transporter ATP-binding protein [Actinophytocola sp.]|uniref:ABC transporter ATP-binding protein n=1 Tax=Actinophytocola sp. TaxID=1872138 RepID=UPI003D6A43E5